ncbi:hypothetical protein KG828_002700 [Escherichia coli]|nr:hypothetical protein [Escherichia coli]EHJ6177774.1 hypothetical protein [Escherichia coli]EHL5597244.1 hypothetical protein [Escherichia coli]EHM8892061.1 hypothetical protein [Escherichia coli]EHN0047915.1 hypothetical protein [Escherichia coli]EHN0172360.1 hypothetical protein [Escherichia coli]
MIIKTLKMSA